VSYARTMESRPHDRAHTVRDGRLVETTEDVNREVAENAMLLSQGARRAIEMRDDAHAAAAAPAVPAARVPSQFPELEPYPRVRELLEVQVDMQFADLHSLLRLPMPDEGLDGGCNLTATTVLCNIVAGTSVLFLDSSIDVFVNRNDRGPRFKRLMRDYYPWLPEDALRGEEGAMLLWEYTRNPLSHTLGVGKFPHAFPGMPGDGRAVLLSKGPLPDAGIAQLMAEERPMWLDHPTIEFDGRAYTVSVLALTWGVYRMLHRLFSDADQMQAAERTARTLLTDPPPRPRGPDGDAGADAGDWVRLETEGDFDEYSARPGVIVNVDPATDAAENGPKAHGTGCPYITREQFIARFVEHNGQGGYYWARDMGVARRQFGARPCGALQDPLNAASPGSASNREAR
jgi:hypothetical protein